MQYLYKKQKCSFEQTKNTKKEKKTRKREKRYLVISMPKVPALASTLCPLERCSDSLFKIRLPIIL